MSGKEPWTVLPLIALLLAGLAVAKLHSKTLGVLLVAPCVVYALVSLRRMPREEKARLAAAIEAREKTLWGRVDRIIKLVILLCLAAAAVQWLLGRL